MSELEIESEQLTCSVITAAIAGSSAPKNTNSAIHPIYGTGQGSTNSPVI
jgi:hypothetical protein